RRPRSAPDTRPPDAWGSANANVPVPAMSNLPVPSGSGGNQSHGPYCRETNGQSAQTRKILRDDERECSTATSGCGKLRRLPGSPGPGQVASTINSARSIQADLVKPVY